MPEPKTVSKSDMDTKVTIEGLHHDLNQLKEIINTRLDAMDKAASLFQENLTRVPTDVDKQVTQLKSIIDTRIDAMDLATKLLRESMGRVPSDTDKQVQHLREL